MIKLAKMPPRECAEFHRILDEGPKADYSWVGGLLGGITGGLSSGSIAASRRLSLDDNQVYMCFGTLSAFLSTIAINTMLSKYSDMTQNATLAGVGYRVDDDGVSIILASMWSMIGSILSHHISFLSRAAYREIKPVITELLDEVKPVITELLDEVK